MIARDGDPRRLIVISPDEPQLRRNVEIEMTTLDELEFDPNPLETRKSIYTRYEIDECDQERLTLDETEWFCDYCGDWIADIDEPECGCEHI